MPRCTAYIWMITTFNTLPRSGILQWLRNLLRQSARAVALTWAEVMKLMDSSISRVPFLCPTCSPCLIEFNNPLSIGIVLTRVIRSERLDFVEDERCMLDGGVAMIFLLWALAVIKVNRILSCFVPQSSYTFLYS